MVKLTIRNLVKGLSGVEVLVMRIVGIDNEDDDG